MGIIDKVRMGLGVTPKYLDPSVLPKAKGPESKWVAMPQDGFNQYFRARSAADNEKFLGITARKVNQEGAPVGPYALTFEHGPHGIVVPNPADPQNPFWIKFNSLDPTEETLVKSGKEEINFDLWYRPSPDTIKAGMNFESAVLTFFDPKGNQVEVWPTALEAKYTPLHASPLNGTAGHQAPPSWRISAAEETSGGAKIFEMADKPKNRGAGDIYLNSDVAVDGSVIRFAHWTGIPNRPAAPKASTPPTAPAPAPKAPPTAAASPAPKAPAAAAPAPAPKAPAPAAPMPKAGGSALTLKCGRCHTIFDVQDPGKRPLYSTCPGCGVNGIVRETPKAPAPPAPANPPIAPAPAAKAPAYPAAPLPKAPPAASASPAPPPAKPAAPAPQQAPAPEAATSRYISQGLTQDSPIFETSAVEISETPSDPSKSAPGGESAGDKDGKIISMIAHFKSQIMLFNDGKKTTIFDMSLPGQAKFVDASLEDVTLRLSGNPEQLTDANKPYASRLMDITQPKDEQGNLPMVLTDHKEGVRQIIYPGGFTYFEVEAWGKIQRFGIGYAPNGHKLVQYSATEKPSPQGGEHPIDLTLKWNPANKTVIVNGGTWKYEFAPILPMQYYLFEGGRAPAGALEEIILAGGA